MKIYSDCLDQFASEDEADGTERKCRERLHSYEGGPTAMA